MSRIGKKSSQRNADVTACKDYKNKVKTHLYSQAWFGSSSCMCLSHSTCLKPTSLCHQVISVSFGSHLSSLQTYL